MSISQSPLTTKIAESIDGDSSISLRELLSKIYVRPGLFWACVIIPPLLAILLTFLIPAEYKATSKILIRYSSSESAFMQDLIPQGRALLSGGSSVEIVLSIPTLVETIRNNDIREEHVSKEPHEVLGGYVSGWLSEYFPQELPPGLPDVDPATLLLAKTFKDSLEDNVEILEASSSNLPLSMRGDELISITVPSFEREKVAEMANGLANAFIDQYYELSAEDARRAYHYLDTLVSRAEQQLADIELHGAGAAQMLHSGVVSSGIQEMYRASPRLESTSKDIAQLEVELARLKQTYRDDSPEVVQVQGRIDALKKTFNQQEYSELAKEVLGELKLRRYQAYMTEELYRNRLIPISIIEPAFTPKKTVFKLVLRYVIAAGVGLILGLVLALGLVTVLGIIDQRLFSSWDFEKWSKLPILGAIPNFHKRQRSDELTIVTNERKNLDEGIFQILGGLDSRTLGNTGNIITISGVSSGEGKSFVAYQLAVALGKDRRNRVMLIDGSLEKSSLSRYLGYEKHPGLIDVISNAIKQDDVVVQPKSCGFSFMPLGTLEDKGGLGFYGKSLKALGEQWRNDYDITIIDTSGVLSGTEATMFAMNADGVVMTVESGVTRKSTLSAATRKLQEVGVSPLGLVLNKRKQLLPAILYKLV